MLIFRFIILFWVTTRIGSHDVISFSILCGAASLLSLYGPTSKILSLL